LQNRNLLIPLIPVNRLSSTDQHVYDSGHGDVNVFVYFSEFKCFGDVSVRIVNVWLYYFSTIDQCIFFIGPNCASVRSYICQWVSCLPRQLTFLFLHFTLVCVVTSTKMTENHYQNIYIRILQQENKCIGYFP
jgi:hypothetical protein